MRQELIERLLKLRDETYAKAVRTVFDAGTEHQSSTDRATVEKLIAHNLPLFGTTPEGKRLLEALKNEPDTRFEFYKKKLSREALVFVRQALAQGFKQLPHGGGRPGAFSDDKKREVCGAVLKLILGGMSEAAAIREVAHLSGVSVRTMRRTWKARTPFSASPETVNPDNPDGLKALSPKRARRSTKI
jgi:hypothetical protein